MTKLPLSLRIVRKVNRLFDDGKPISVSDIEEIEQLEADSELLNGMIKSGSALFRVKAATYRDFLEASVKKWKEKK
jgi:hypothetical protein